MGLWSRHQERQAQWAPGHNAPFLPATAAHRQNGAQVIDEFLRQGPIAFPLRPKAEPPLEGIDDPSKNAAVLMLLKIGTRRRDLPQREIENEVVEGTRERGLLCGADRPYA